MATAVVFIQQSTEYIQQIETEIQRLQQLRDQIQFTIQSGEQLEGNAQPARRNVRKSSQSVEKS